MNIHPIYKLCLAFAVMLLVSCQSDKSAVGGYFNLDTDLKIEFKVESGINPDESSTPSPLFVRMYELTSDQMMKTADFLDIYENDKVKLGADLVKIHKLKRFKPGENRTEQLVLDPTTKYVGLYAEFLEFNRAKYKLTFPVVSNNVFKNTVVIRISGNDLILVKQ